MGERSKGTFGEPDEWEFDYPWRRVKIGFWLWSMSGFQTLPTQDDVSRYDERWVSDMQLAKTLYDFQNNNSQEMRLFNKAIAIKEEQGRIKMMTGED